MPRGLPDYYNPDTLVSQRLANVEEVVTALQGVASLDNRGRMFHFVPFNQSLNGWTLSVVGDGSLPVISSDYALLEPASMKMDAGTVTGGGGSQARKFLLVSKIAKAGLAFSFQWDEQWGDLQTTFGYDDGAYRLQADFRIYKPTPAVQIYTGGAWVTVHSLPAAGADPYWSFIKVVADFANSSYERMIVGQDEVDLSAYPLREEVRGAATSLITTLLHLATDDGTNLAYLGHVVFTVDEP